MKLSFLNLEILKKINTQQHNPSGIPNNIISKFILKRNNKRSLVLRETLKKYIPRNVLEILARKT